MMSQAAREVLEGAVAQRIAARAQAVVEGTASMPPAAAKEQAKMMRQFSDANEQELLKMFEMIE